MAESKTTTREAVLWAEYRKLYARLETHPSDFRTIARMGVVREEWKRAFMKEYSHD